MWDDRCIDREELDGGFVFELHIDYDCEDPYRGGWTASVLETPREVEGHLADGLYDAAADLALELKLTEWWDEWSEEAGQLREEAEELAENLVDGNADELDRWVMREVSEVVAVEPTQSGDYAVVVYQDGAEEAGCKTPEEAEALARGERETYDQWCAGETYGFKLFDPSGEEVESCWGFIGDTDWVREAATENLDYHRKAYFAKTITNALGGHTV